VASGVAKKVVLVSRKLLGCSAGGAFGRAGMEVRLREGKGGEEEMATGPHRAKEDHIFFFRMREISIVNIPLDWWFGRRAWDTSKESQSLALGKSRRETHTSPSTGTHPADDQN
jgi:hypothetical protein